MLLFGCLGEGVQPPISINESSNASNASVVVKHNVKPTAVILMDKTVFVEGEDVSFIGEGSDADGRVAAFSWRTDTGGQMSAEQSFATNILPVGTHQVFFKVNDDAGDWSDEATITIEVKAVNAKPVAFIGNVSKSEAVFGEEITFAGRGADADGTVEAFEWSSSVDGVLSVKSNFSVSNLSVATHEVKLRVEDNAGEWSNAVVVEVNVSNAVLPKAKITVATPNPANAGGMVSLGGVGVDASSEITEYYWESDREGILRKLQKIETYLSIGPHIIRFKVKNAKGTWSAFDERIVNIYSDQIAFPKPRINTITPSPAKKGTKIYFSGNADDIDGNIMAYAWRSSLDGNLSTQPDFEIYNLTVGRHYIYFKAKDNANNWSPETAAILDVK